MAFPAGLRAACSASTATVCESATSGARPSWAAGWASLRRWSRSVRAGRLFPVARALPAEAQLRQVAARAATTLAACAPASGGLFIESAAFLCWYYAYRQGGLAALLDEAHLLHPEMLGHLHILLNYEWDSRALLSLILVGLPELKDQLQLRRFRSLQSRIHWRLHADPITPEDTAEYLRYRMKRAGSDRDVFTQDAVQMLHEAAISGMRDLDRLATGCLREAARKKRKFVERDLLARFLDRDGLERSE